MARPASDHSLWTKAEWFVVKIMAERPRPLPTNRCSDLRSEPGAVATGSQHLIAITTPDRYRSRSQHYTHLIAITTPDRYRSRSQHYTPLIAIMTPGRYRPRF